MFTNVKKEEEEEIKQFCWLLATGLRRLVSRIP